MTREEAKALIMWINPHGLKKINEKGKDIILEALEKQVPKKPIDNFFDKRCPSCNNLWGITKDQQFCPKCGQAIEWDESR